MRFIALAKEVVLKQLLEQPYWEQVFKTRDNDPSMGYTELSVWVDLFKIGTSPEDKKPKFVCLVPNTRFHWDTILALYHLFAPEVYPTDRHPAHLLFNFIHKTGIPLEGFVNFDDHTMDYLFRYSTGLGKPFELGAKNLFLSEPAATIYQIKRIHTLLARGFTGGEPDSELEDAKVVIQNETKEEASVPLLVLLGQIEKDTEKEVRGYLEKQ